MKLKELYDYITERMSPEQALMKMLEGALIQYEMLKIDSEHEAVHPTIIIAMAAMDMGWQISVERDDEEINGLVVGTKEYVNKILNHPQG